MQKLEGQTSLTPDQMRIVDKYILAGTLTGVQWEKVNRVSFEDLSKKIVREQKTFV